MRVLRVVICLLIFVVMTAETVMATPSTIIWIPSTDIQPFMVGHIGIDNYFRTGTNSVGGRDPNVFDLGFTLGILPFDKVQMEVGFDFLAIAGNPNDQHPWSGNAKLGTPEDSMFKYSPALVVGIYNGRPVKDIEVQDRPFVQSGQNIVYGLVSKTVPAIGSLPSLGRFAAGWYRGSERALVKSYDPNNRKPDNSGILLSWDRTLSEISDKLWFGVDYMGGGNVDSSINVGIAWRFAKNVSVLFGYDMYQKVSLSGEDTFTLQVDIDFP